MAASLFAFPIGILAPDTLPERGDNMDKPKARVEPCIYKILGTDPIAYWVEVSAANGARKLRQTVIGLRKARDVRAAFRLQLKSSLTVKVVFKNITSCLAHYLRKKYRFSSQWKIGSGRRKLHFWRDEIGKVDPRNLTKEDLNEIVHRMQADGYENSGIKPYIGTLKAALNYCNEEGRIKIDMAEFEKLTDLKVKRVPKLSISRDDMDAIIAGMPGWTRPYMTAKILIPSRVLEWHAVRTASVDLEKRTFWFDDDATKNREAREMVIPGALENYFKEAVQSGRQFVFMRPEAGKDGIVRYFPLSRNLISKLFSAARDTLGLDSRIKLRLTRHGAIRDLKRLIGDAGTVAALAGSSEETIERHYDVVELLSKVEAMRKMEEAQRERLKGLNILEFKTKAAEA